MLYAFAADETFNDGIFPFVHKLAFAYKTK